MYHFFTETEFFTGTEAVITGPDVNHIKNVLRMKPGEKILLSDGKGTNCLCEITELFPDKVLAKILPEEVDDTELPVQVTLYQGLPKADKMEFIIQKCVELGVTKIVPVDTDRAVVKLDAKKEEAKRKRRLERLEMLIAQKEEELAAYQSQMKEPSIQSDFEKLMELEALCTAADEQLEVLMTEWEESGS